MTCRWRFLRLCTPICTLAIGATLGLPSEAGAQESHSHQEEAAHHTGLHFSHPLLTESVSPDTKIRINLGAAWSDGEREQEIELEGEYAFHRSFSIEFGAPIVFVQPDGASSVSGIGNFEVALKFANYAFEDHGVLLGYGVEFGVPTGDATDGIGSDHLWEVEPFLNIGYKHDHFELVAFSIFGIPFNQNAGEDVETELAYNFSGLVHVAPRVQALVELTGQTVMSGDEAGQTVLLLSPGIKVAPFARSPLFLGFGVSVPLTTEELDASARFSLFHHF